jgi:hypothetical protein
VNKNKSIERCLRVLFSGENFFRRATYILFPGSELVSCDTEKSFAAQAKIGKSFAARHGTLKSRESSFFSGASEKQSTVRHLSILNFHCTLCCDLIDFSAELQESRSNCIYIQNISRVIISLT